MMLKAVLLFGIFYLIFGTNYINDDDWGLTTNQGWPIGICQYNSFQLTGAPDGSYVEYACNDDGSVTRSNYASISDNGECMDFENSVNYTSFNDPGDVGAFECNSTNDYAEIYFFGHLFSDPESNQCDSSSDGTGNFKWSVNTCASKDNNSIMFTCSADSIIFTRYNNIICDSSSIIEVITINKGKCTKYSETQQPYGFFIIDIFTYATYGSCHLSVPTTTQTLTPSISPIENAIEQTDAPSTAPSVTPTTVPTLTLLDVTDEPIKTPTNSPSTTPTTPTTTPTYVTDVPSKTPTNSPSNSQNIAPSDTPTTKPTLGPTSIPSIAPTDVTDIIY